MCGSVEIGLSIFSTFSSVIVAAFFGVLTIETIRQELTKGNGVPWLDVVCGFGVAAFLLAPSIIWGVCPSA